MLDRLFSDALAWVAGSGAEPGRPPSARPTFPPDLAAARAAFRLPPRGRYELPASLGQKRALERHGGRDYDLIDALGTEQADCLLHYLDAEAQVLARQSQRAADKRRRGRLFGRSLLLLGLVDVGAVALLTGDGGLISQGSVVFERRASAAPGVAASGPADPALPSVSGSPAPASVAVVAPVVPHSAAFLTDVAYSRASALARYPDLAVSGSAFNARFLALYRDCQSRNDPRLQRSNWPEMLASECAAHSGTVAVR